MIKLLFGLFLFASLPLCALSDTENIHVIEIRYEVFVENADSLSTYQYNLPYEAYHIVSADRVMTLNKYAADVDEVHVYDLANQLEYQCYIHGEKKKMAVKSPLVQIPTLVTNKVDEQRYQIGGMWCNKYEILHKNQPIEIFTTDGFGVDFTPFADVQGYAMQYSFIDEVYGKVTYVAKSIYPTITSLSTFSLADFEITDEVFSSDFRSSQEESIITKESKALFKLNKKNINYKFKLSDKKNIITSESDPNNLVVMAICGFYKLNPLDKELIGGLINSVKDENVDFYYFANKGDYHNKEVKALKELGFEVAYIKDLLMSKFKVEYYPTYILLDKDRKVIKYKIGTNSDMLESFRDKIIELSDD